MPDDSPPRVQFVISGKFVALLLTALALLGGGYYWYIRQQQVELRSAQIQERFKTPPYFVNHGVSVIRPCRGCLADGVLKPQTEWKIGESEEIPDAEQRWYLAVEDPPAPMTVSGVLMLPAYAAIRNNPALGFDQSSVVLVLFQSLQRMNRIESPPPASPVGPAGDDSPAKTPAAEPGPQQPDVTPLPIVGTEPAAPAAPTSHPETPRLLAPIAAVNSTSKQTWRVTLTPDADWFDTGIPLIAEMTVYIRPDPGSTIAKWRALVGNKTYFPVKPSLEDYFNILDNEPFIDSPRWLTTLRMQVSDCGSDRCGITVRIVYLARPREAHKFTDDGPGAWERHQMEHQQMRDQAERIISILNGRQ